MGMSSSARSALLAATALSAADKRPITETDLFRFVWVADPQISPDGKRVAFVRVTVNEKKDGYDTALWIVAADGCRRSPRRSRAGRATSPRAGRRTAKWLAFTRAAEKDGKPQPPSSTSSRARAARPAR